MRAEWENRVDRKLIFDIGMHHGGDTEFYLLKGFDVVAVGNPRQKR